MSKISLKLGYFLVDIIIDYFYKTNTDNKYYTLSELDINNINKLLFFWYVLIGFGGFLSIDAHPTYSRQSSSDSGCPGLHRSPCPHPINSSIIVR